MPIAFAAFFVLLHQKLIVMSQSNIITGQYVQINQSPASIGERIFGRLIDLLVLFCYVGSMSYLMKRFHPDFRGEWITVFVIILPFALYTFLCESFNHGQTIGKKVMHTRVVSVDGTVPTMGASMIRWLMLLVDLWMTSGMGVLFIIFSKNNQRLGDLAAGTMVIKLDDYKKMTVSLDEFNYVSRNYKPVYPQAQQLTQQQIAVIEQLLHGSSSYDEKKIRNLSLKIQQLLDIEPQEDSDIKFLVTLLHDSYYYSIEIL